MEDEIVITVVKEVVEMSLYKAEMEQRLRDSELRFRMVADFAYDWETWLGPEGDYLYVSPSCERITGYSREVFLEDPRHLFRITHPEDKSRMENHCEACHEMRDPFSRLEFRIVRTDKEVRWIEHLCRPVFSPDGKYLVRRASNRDITDRKKGEEQLRKSEEKFKLLAENSADVIYKLNIANEHYTYVSPSIKRMLGYSTEDIPSLRSRDTVTPESYTKQRDMITTSLANGGRDPEILELEAVHKDGHTLPVEVHARILFDEQGNPVEILGVVRDITKRKQAEKEKMKLEAQLHQAKKMEAIATLAGGIAHEFNNALMALMGNVELLEMDFSEDEGSKKYFDAAKNSGHRMSRLTDQLLAYARGGKYRPENMKLDDFVMETLPILSHRLNPAVRMETTFSKGVSYINADHTQMQMVLSAILNNANEATDDAGLIIISAENKAVDEDFAEQHPGFKPGPYVCLSIEDNGKGMNEEEISRIFDPFFTTKFQGRGMGMPAVYGIVKNHDGWISVDSEAGKGTVVRIYFPAVDAESKTPEIRQAEPRIGEGTILVIEDEKMVIDVAQGMLEKLGYRVLTAMTGKDAIHLTKTFDGNIDLALLDIKLPDMQGGRVYPLIMEAHPDLKVIVCSGYDIDGPVRGILDAGAQGFLQKPFSLGILSEKVKEIMKI